MSDEWGVVGWSKDPVDGGDLDQVAHARRRYNGIAETIESAVARLDRITASEDQLRGKYADELRKKATEVHEKLAKAAVRYADVAREVAVYEPELSEALVETRAGLADGKAAAGALATAEALPDGEPDEGGVLDDADVAADVRKRQGIATADTNLAAAKRRVQTAFDQLQVAGKRLGHAVSARRYDDGLTDSGWDKATAVLKKISRILSIIGMVLAVLCFIFPGVAALLLVAAAVAVAGLVAAAILYAKNEEGLPDLIFAILGVVLLGGAAWVTTVTRSAKAAAHTKNFGTLKVPPKSLQQPVGEGKVVVRVNPAAAGSKARSEGLGLLSKAISTVFRRPHVPTEVGLGRSSLEQLREAGRMWGQATSLRGAGALGKDWWKGVSGISQYRSLKEARLVVDGSASKWWVAWTFGNSAFTFGPGLVWTGLRTEWRDWRDQKTGEFGKIEDL
ncbi:hypothetical protein [Cellulomonas dongxiuzhuiae]|uniref:Uncharacterized protein n=1 Tax=Cellulomonas dongxiuzhuiae TaxID=2819979 RepID=A0ABX8GJJ6_9CELL|nr:hypothetical protein [Cellulomonas dongxiuzhuiae]MBO3094859.1 hypothetical protein [Cellulomonas dongxiuzhuiae]QWC15892.1 hypothetical protein KKR89_16805 [Cellulomonas dongxiuzhuiae]